MIDTGCQVTILSTTVFQRMCTVNPAVRSALRPCRRRLVSADSSPLMVQGQLELDIVFPGLCCKMLFVVAKICSDSLLGTEALQSYLPHQLDLRTGQLWADGWSTLIELDIVFPGLCCKMLFVVANIGSDGLLGTEALQSYLPHQLDLGQVSCGRMDGLRCSYTNRD